MVQLVCPSCSGSLDYEYPGEDWNEEDSEITHTFKCNDCNKTFEAFYEFKRLECSECGEVGKCDCKQEED